MLTLERIYNAQKSLQNIILPTELLKASKIGTNCTLYLKTENLQLTGSFKIRGAYNKISKLTEEEKNKGIVACSAGNHAQGVAFAAKKLGISAEIYIPSTAPIAKIEATRSYGANVVLINGVYDDAYQAALLAQQKYNYTFIHPFNDLDIIAGQGTIALELLNQCHDLDAIVVPIGGGGLIGGIAYTAKQLNPNIKIYGVQAIGAPSMKEALDNNSIDTLPEVNTIADGIAVKRPGDLTFQLCQQYVDQVVLVDDNEISVAILALMDQQKLIAEGAGAVSLAAVLFDKLPIHNKKVACIISGGNIDMNILSRITHRGLLKSGRYCEILIDIMDKTGLLTDISRIISEKEANIVNVTHNYGNPNTHINECFLNIALETRNHQHIKQIHEALTHAGYKIIN